MIPQVTTTCSQVRVHHLSLHLCEGLLLTRLLHACEQCRQEGRPLEDKLVAALAGQGFAQPTSPPVWLQSFEVEVSTGRPRIDTRRGARVRRVVRGRTCSTFIQLRRRIDRLQPAGSCDMETFDEPCTCSRCDSACCCTSDPSSRWVVLTAWEGLPRPPEPYLIWTRK